MEFDNLFDPPQDEPVIDERVSEATAQHIRGLVRVTLEVKRARRGKGWRKINSFRTRERGPGQKPEESEEEVNAAIMSIALHHAEETGEDWIYRAKYYRKDHEGKEQRRFVRFTIDEADDEQEHPAAGMSSEEATVAIYTSNSRAQSESYAMRERMLMEFCMNLTDRLVTTASQAEPILATQNRSIAYFQQAMTMMWEALQTKGAAAAQDDEDESGFLKEVLLPAGKLAIAQHLQSKVGPGDQPALPEQPQTPPRPAHPVAASSKAFLCSLKPQQWWQLTDRLTDRQRTLLRCAGNADTDAQASQAIATLREELTGDLPRALALREILTDPQWAGLQKITALAMQVAGTQAQPDTSVDEGASTPAARQPDADVELPAE